MSENKYTPPQTPEELVLTWIKRVRESQFSHHHCVEFYKVVHFAIGVPATILTAIVGTSIFKVATSSPNSSPSYLIISLSILAAILSGLQTFLNVQAKINAHKIAADKFSEIRRDLEEAYATSQINATLISAAKTKYNNATQNAPDVSSSVFSKITTILYKSPQ
ncbi:SLATT domain-containing protein [Chromobacterium vaccinii]|uniref:SLATT domain-containing protein n=1 Tax=Chromobacterium vaccinii TaxID=1108595 RepID=UPI001E28FE06|nr:SLATT domain-containing protein [Chromobacterium vaccinii]MCD4486913.1 SLATT domain-containing protein [Chromobacterium vaccinii]